MALTDFLVAMEKESTHYTRKLIDFILVYLWRRIALGLQLWLDLHLRLCMRSWLRLHLLFCLCMCL